MRKFSAALAIILVMAASAILISGFTHEQSIVGCQRYYDVQLDSLQKALRSFASAAERPATTTATLKQHLFNCRNTYKRIELFMDLFDPLSARLINGPDLLRINEENPSDSLMPHGFQVIEGILFSEKPERRRLRSELSQLKQLTQRLRNDPDRAYYFKPDRVWWATQLATYRLISLGITGFDVPLSEHAAPEAVYVLSSVKAIVALFKDRVSSGELLEGNRRINAAISYLAANREFRSLDRATLIRRYLNPISEWLAVTGRSIRGTSENPREPLNAAATSLFAPNMVNVAFFSPNSRYRISSDRVQLGKLLFSDVRLSGSGTRSCASCHKPERAFTDGLTKPYALSGKGTLERNTPTLWYSALQTRQFYDSRTETLENQLSAVVHNADEMAGSLSQVIPMLTADSAYYSLFKRAYSNDLQPVSEYTIANAISSYVRTLISFNSRFDRYIRGETDSFSAAEKNGFNLFMGKAKCGTCHYAPVFNGLTPPLYEDTESEILGVPVSDIKKQASLDGDPGKYSFTKLALHRYAFKTPTVRNSELTAPYMHNGAFATLLDVVNFYNDGGGAGRGINLATQTLPAEKLNLSQVEISNIVAFLQALTDTSAIH